MQIGDGMPQDLGRHALGPTTANHRTCDGKFWDQQQVWRNYKVRLWSMQAGYSSG